MTKQLDSTHSLKYADIDWRADGTPVSRHYDDVYFSRTHGLDESRHVFLQGNRFSQRWQHMPANTHFIIIETGFGTGLNLLASWQLWNRTAPANCHLHYISIEKHPLPAAELARALSQWPELQALSDILYRNYPPAIPGIHQIALQDRVTLSLGFGDIIDVLDQLRDCDYPGPHAQSTIAVDAWLLDGFAPAKNPDMWSAAVFHRVASLSAPGTSFATFTAAGIVKRGLQAVGFELRKIPGFGPKRDMLCGQLGSCTTPTPDEPRSPRAVAPWHCGATADFKTRSALVIGAGLAGCHTARALADSGWQVTVLEQAPQYASAASGNPSGILYTRLAAGDSDQGAFSLSAYLYAGRIYRAYFERQELVSARDGQLNGMLQLGFNHEEREAIDKIARRYRRFSELVRPLSAAEASEISGVAIEHPALLFPASGWLKPRSVCRQLLQHEAIELVGDCPVRRLEYSEQGWRLHTANGDRYEAAICVVCCGIDSGQFDSLAELPIRGVGGQVTVLPGATPMPLLALCHSGYVAPIGDDGLCCGASFRINDSGDDMRDADHEYNLQQLSCHVPGLLPPATRRSIELSGLAGRASVRCTTPDYLPIVGPAPKLADIREAFAPLARNARAVIDSPGSYHPGLYVNTGHGSKGLATTPIAAACIAALANRTPRPLPWRLMRAINPTRFAIRSLIKGQG